MADIDKALPNVETEIKVPGEEEIAVALIPMPKIMTTCIKWMASHNRCITT